MANGTTTVVNRPQLPAEIQQRLARERAMSDSLWGAGLGTVWGGLIGLVLGNTAHGAKVGAVIGAIAPQVSDRARAKARAAEQRVGEIICGVNEI